VNKYSIVMLVLLIAVVGYALTFKASPVGQATEAFTSGATSVLQSSFGYDEQYHQAMDMTILALEPGWFVSYFIRASDDDGNMYFYMNGKPIPLTPSPEPQRVKVTLENEIDDFYTIENVVVDVHQKDNLNVPKWFELLDSNTVDGGIAPKDIQNALDDTIEALYTHEPPILHSIDLQNPI